MFPTCMQYAPLSSIVTKTTMSSCTMTTLCKQPFAYLGKSLVLASRILIHFFSLLIRL